MICDSIYSTPTKARTDKLNPETFSFNAGWNAAIDKVVVDSTGWNRKLRSKNED